MTALTFAPAAAMQCRAPKLLPLLLAATGALEWRSLPEAVQMVDRFEDTAKVDATNGTANLLRAAQWPTNITAKGDSWDHKWTMRLCNAFAFNQAMHVYHQPVRKSTYEAVPKEEKLTTGSGPLPFGQCADIHDVYVEQGSTFNWRYINGDVHVGTFAVKSLPYHGDVPVHRAKDDGYGQPWIQLAIMRHDEFTTTAHFVSHVFDNFGHDFNPQVVIIDAYRGPERATLEVRDTLLRQAQPLNFDSAITITPGHYEWILYSGQAGPKAHLKAAWSLEAEAHQKYTAIRVGVDALRGPDIPEGLVLFPGASFQMRGDARRSSTVAMAVGILVATMGFM